MPVDHSPRVGGSAPITRTRVSVWALEAYRRGGWSDARILDSFPTLRAADLVAAFAYAAEHEGEIDREIAENAAA